MSRLGHGTTQIPAAIQRHWLCAGLYFAASAALIAWVDAPASATIRSPQLERDSNRLSNDLQDFGEPALVLGTLLGASGCSKSDAAICAGRSPGRGLTAWQHLEVAAATVLFATASVQGLKLAAGRERPNVLHDGDGGFNESGSSFPSGHAMVAFALASVLAHEYPRRAWVRWAGYSLATVIAGLRFTAQKHFPSDLVVGSMLGYWEGRCATGPPFCRAF